MKTTSITDRCIEVLALAMIGEGVVGLIRPSRYMRFWKLGPESLREFIEQLAEDRDCARLICLGEVAAGLWIALRQINRQATSLR